MMKLAVVTTGTCCGSVGVTRDGLLLDAEMLARIGAGEGDEVEVHTDGSMLVLVKVRRPAENPPGAG